MKKLARATDPYNNALKEAKLRNKFPMGFDKGQQNSHCAKARIMGQRMREKNGIIKNTENDC